MKISWQLQLVPLLLALLVRTPGADKLVVPDHRCTKSLTCGQCISAHPKCSWCKQEEYGHYVPRCDLKENLIKRNCTEFESPKSNIKIIKDLPLSEAGIKTESYVQMKPQKIRLKLRPHETISFPVVFRQAEDYPLDLYYLMDLTYSMRDDKEKLFELRNKLVDSISNLTSNFRLGFGSFVDKVVLPYVNTVPSKLENPCVDGIVCARPYGFRNHMSLSNNSRKFAEEVANAEVSANLDDAEGGFDAIMQVIVCKDEIDWNNKSRKIVLFATDSGFHYAGDGKLGGIVVPNDGKCHLNKEGFYTMSNFQDYPSLSQINRKVKENKVILIFAVPTSQMSVYTQLSKAIEGSYTQELATDSSNIVELVKQQYHEISSEVDLQADNLPDFIRATFTAECPGGKKGSNLCKGVKVGTEVHFNVSLTLEGCPKSAVGWSHEFVLYPVGLNEALDVQLEMLCECDCEMENVGEINSTVCNGQGTYECGVCNCYDNKFGRSCECNSTNPADQTQTHFENCRVGNSSMLCSGRGQCLCGVCECTARANPLEVVSGPQCQCDNFTCPRDDQQRICGGPSRGYCECMECICEEGWSGNTCSCSTKNDTCLNSNGVLCSDNGYCQCGQCKCTTTSKGRYGGQFCEDCPDCRGKCDFLRPCVECSVWKTGDFSGEDCKTNCIMNITTEKSLPDNPCIFQDKDGCTFRFTYSFDAQNKPIVIVLEDKDCPQAANLLAIILGVAGGILFAGIVIALIVRLCMYLKDRRDYARFLEEVNKTNWAKQEQNPIYKAAISNYTNPTYGQTKPAH